MKIKTIFLLHGWGGDSSRLKALEDELISRNYQVINHDLPGFGKNPPPDVPWTLEDYVRYIESKMIAGQMHDIVVVGHSFGAQIAVKLGYNNPHLICGLVLVAPAVIRVKISFKKMVLRYIVEIGKTILKLPILNKLTEWSRWFLYQLIRSKDYYRAQGTMRDTLRNIIGEEMERYLEKLPQKTLLLWGEDDALTPFKQHKKIINLIPRVELKAYHNEGHNFLYYRASDVADDIEGFIAKLP